MDIDKIKKEEVIKQVQKLTVEEKEEVKLQLQKINYKEEIINFFEKLNLTVDKEERTGLITSHQNIIQHMDKGEEDEMLTIIADKESEEYWQEGLFVQDDFEGLDVKQLQEEIRQYRQRKAKEEGEELERRRIEKIQIEEETLDKATKESKASRLLSVKDDWMALFKKVSYENEVAGEILFHVFVGQMLKHINIYDKRGKTVLMKVDFFWIQNSSSGKGEGIDNFLKPIINNFEYDVTDEETKQTLTLKLKYSTFRGQSTLAGILNRYKKAVTGKNYTNEIIVGPIQKSDFWIWTEANDLLTPNQYNKSLIDAILDLMEGKEYEAFLEKYNKPILTKSTGSLVATSRPVENIDIFFIRSGLANRCLTFMRSLGVKKMEEMIEKGAVQSFGKLEDSTNFDIEIKQLTKKLKEIVIWSMEYKYKPYPQTDSDILNSLVNTKLKEIMEDIKRDVKVKQYRDVLIEYVGRMKNKAIALSYHNAIIRRQPVDIQDIVGAFELLKLCYNNYKFWLFENMMLRKEVTEKEYKLYFLIKKMLNESINNEIKVIDVKKAIENRKDLNLSGHYIYSKIREVVETYNNEFEKLNKNIIKLKTDEGEENDITS